MFQANFVPVPNGVSPVKAYPTSNKVIGLLTYLIYEHISFYLFTTPLPEDYSFGTHLPEAAPK